MKTYQVGPDPLCQGDFDALECRGKGRISAFEWFVYWCQLPPTKVGGLQQGSCNPATRGRLTEALPN